LKKHQVIRFYIVTFFLVLAASGHSQETWGPPFPLTDSVTDNVNATLSIVPGEVIQPDTLYILWEKSSDSLSTGIYARNLTAMAGPFMAASRPGAHFRHPRVYSRGIGDTLFYFTYETDMNGNWDLYYSILMKNEVVLGPFPFIRSFQNERNLNFGVQTFSWEKEGNILVKSITGDTVHLASDSCHNPVQSPADLVAYEMATGQELGVFYSKYDEISQLWTGPYPLDIYGTNSHLTFGNDSYGADFAQYVLWQHKNGPFWVIKGFDTGNGNFCSFTNFAGCNNVSPSFCNIKLITGKAEPFTFPYSTFASDVNGNMEIYVNEVWFDTIRTNLSDYSGPDIHPQLFNYFHPYGSGFENKIYNIWESHRGGHWQLWAANLEILTGDEALKSPGSLIRCSPNPFTDKTCLEYFIKEPGPVAVTIFDLRGRKIKILEGNSDGQEKHSVIWDGKDGAGVPVPSGIYMGSVRTKKDIHRCKIIRL
jgi:hypothetical protein